MTDFEIERREICRKKLASSSSSWVAVPITDSVRHNLSPRNSTLCYCRISVDYSLLTCEVPVRFVRFCLLQVAQLRVAFWGMRMLWTPVYVYVDSDEEARVASIGRLSSRHRLFVHVHNSSRWGCGASAPEIASYSAVHSLTFKSSRRFRRHCQCVRTIPNNIPILYRDSGEGGEPGTQAEGSRGGRGELS